MKAEPELQGPEPIINPIERSLRGMRAMSAEIEGKLGEIRECPGPCGDGTVVVPLSSERGSKVPCPLIGGECAYGRGMEQALERRLSEILCGAGVPIRYLGHFFELRESRAGSEAMKWTASGFLVLAGETGTGKSFGAALALRIYLKNLIRNRFDRTSWEIAERAANAVAWHSAMDFILDREAAARGKSAHLAVIDDLGGEDESPSGAAVIRSVILKRYDMMRPTVITTPLTMMDIELRYSGRIAERIVEEAGGGGTIIDCGKDSMRVGFSAGALCG